MQASVSAAVPIVSGDTVFISAGYGAGAAALRVKAGGVEKLWSGEEQLTAQYVTPVLRDGFLYGFDGRVDTGPAPTLRCVELTTGKVHWSTDKVAHGGIILAGSDLFITTDRGELVRVAAEPKEFREKARAQILGFEGRAQPALADGLLFARDKGQLVAVAVAVAQTNKQSASESRSPEPTGYRSTVGNLQIGTKLYDRSGRFFGTVSGIRGILSGEVEVMLADSVTISRSGGKGYAKWFPRSQITANYFTK